MLTDFTGKKILSGDTCWEAAVKSSCWEKPLPGFVGILKQRLGFWPGRAIPSSPSCGGDDGQRAVTLHITLACDAQI